MEKCNNCMASAWDPDLATFTIHAPDFLELPGGEVSSSAWDKKQCLLHVGKIVYQHA